MIIQCGDIFTRHWSKARVIRLTCSGLQMLDEMTLTCWEEIDAVSICTYTHVDDNVGKVLCCQEKQETR